MMIGRLRRRGVLENKDKMSSRDCGSAADQKQPSICKSSRDKKNV